jgi:hypothetical protein
MKPAMAMRNCQPQMGEMLGEIPMNPFDERVEPRRRMRRQMSLWRASTGSVVGTESARRPAATAMGAAVGSRGWLGLVGSKWQTGCYSPASIGPKGRAFLFWLDG